MLQHSASGRQRRNLCCNNPLETKLKISRGALLRRPLAGGVAALQGLLHVRAWRPLGGARRPPGLLSASGEGLRGRASETRDGRASEADGERRSGRARGGARGRASEGEGERAGVRASEGASEGASERGGERPTERASGEYSKYSIIQYNII